MRKLWCRSVLIMYYAVACSLVEQPNLTRRVVVNSSDTGARWRMAARRAATAWNILAWQKRYVICWCRKVCILAAACIRVGDGLFPDNAALLLAAKFSQHMRAPRFARVWHALACGCVAW